MKKEKRGTFYNEILKDGLGVESIHSLIWRIDAMGTDIIYLIAVT